MTSGARALLRAGLRVAAQDPALILWYAHNRVRGGLLPLERAVSDGRSLPPRFVTLKPTLRCNLRCDFCRFGANGEVFGKRDWMEIEDWKRVIDEIAPFGPYLCLTGGEPTLYPHLAELIAHIKSRGLRCVLTTNGTLLEQRAEALMEAPPDAMILSLDGPEEIHDSVRKVSGAYERALRGTQRLAALRKGESAPYLIVNAAITGHTYESALRMVEVAREFGAFALNFQHFWFMTRPMVETHNARWGDCFPLDFDRIGGTATDGVDTDRLYNTIHELKRGDFGLPITFYPELDREEMRTYYGEPEAFTHRTTPSCAWISTDILPNGDVSPCFELVCGNVLRQSFTAIWNSDSFRHHRRRLTSAGPYPVCARCCAYFRED
ncbi:MAG TPA: radical SAM protein [Armatimonadota bacterium]|nr:radical SAM protein [Armatimonadota bacterium]